MTGKEASPSGLIADLQPPLRSDDLLVLDLLREQYRYLKEDAVHARAHQQSFLQWGMATIGALVAATLVALGQNDVPTTRGPFGAVIMLVLGLAVPGAVVCLTLAWAGELVRMERAGWYLRRIEADLRGIRYRAFGSGELRTVMSWETELAAHGVDNRLGKNRLTSLGTAGLLFGVVLGATSLAALVAQAYRSWDSWARSTVCTTLGLEVLGYFVLLLLLGRSLARRTQGLD